MNGICFKDDAQVVFLHAQKFYGDTERTEIEVREA